MLTEISPGVFSFSHPFVEGNIGVVLGSKTALVIDAGLEPADGAAVLEFVKSRGFPRPVLAYTHGHEDHVFGAGVFRGCPVLAHRETPVLLRSRLPSSALQLGVAESDLNERLVWPTQTFPAEYRLDLGGGTARFFPTPGHCRGHVSVLAEEDGVLFSGDAVVTGILPTITEGDGRLLEQTLRRLASLECSALVPGHGPILRGREAIRDWILWEANYLAAVRQRVRTLRQVGGGASVSAESIPFSEFVSPRLPADRHEMIRRHGRVIEKIAAEESAPTGH